MSEPMFTSTQRWILKACGAILVVGLGILAVDKFIVRKGEPSRTDRLSALAEEFDLSEGDAGDRERLENLLKPFAKQTGAAKPTGPFLFREDEAHALWLFEYEELGTAIYRITLPDSTVNVTLFGVLFELKGADDLPEWYQAGNAPAPTPPYDLASIGILNRLSDYRVSMTGNCVLLTTFIETWALKQAMDQQTSPELHAGLYNSAMKVDVQSAVRMVNAMETGAAPVPDFYTLDLDIDISVPMNTGISNRLSEINREVHEKIKADMEQTSERMRAASEQASKERAALLEQQKQESDARLEESKRKMEALREEQKQKMDAIRARARQREKIAEK